MLKLFNVKIVIHIIRCNLPENRKQEQENTSNDVDKFLNIFIRINGCSHVDAEYIDLWLQMDHDGGYSALITAEEIISIMLCFWKRWWSWFRQCPCHCNKPADVMTHAKATSNIDQLISLWEPEGNITDWASNAEEDAWLCSS